MGQGGEGSRYQGAVTRKQGQTTFFGALLRITAFAAALSASSTLANAQQPGKVPRIGFLSALTHAAFPSRIDAFRQGLKELGYIEGKNIVVEYRWADGKTERLPELAAELERLKIDVLVSAGPSATRPAIRATTRTPIVMGFDTDPVGSGFVATLGRPGGRVTGLSSVAPEVSGKQIDILRQILPQLSRVALLGDSNEPGNARTLQETERAARALGIQVYQLDIRAFDDVEAIFQALGKERTGALVVLPSPVVTRFSTRFAALAAKSRLPTMYWGQHHVDAGGLMTYSVNVDDLFRRAAIYVDKILKGAKPAELPVEQPSKFDLVINLKAAKQIGLEIPMSMLARADRVIH